MEEIIKKADVLVEALPYIRSFHNKIFVIKYGGKVMLNESLQKRFLEDLVFLHLVGIRPLLVHGGGAAISQKAVTLGKAVKFMEGRRITDSSMIKIVEETLIEINQKLVKMIKELGVEAVGLNGMREGIIKVRKRESDPDLGFVGEIVEIDPNSIKFFLKKRIIPIIIPLGKGSDKLAYNVNADEAACEIAVAVKAEKFILLTDVKGILRYPEDETSLISTLNQNEAQELIERRVIQEGMIPKVMACIQAMEKGVKKTHIIDGRLPHALLLEVFTDKGIGTEIIK